jgi:hypothetical protein
VTDDGVEGSFKLKPMDHIAARVGWVAITAARMETVIGIILVKLHGEEREVELLGRRWRDTYEDAKRTYARLKDDAAVRGDGDDAAACERFADALSRANLLMQRRHHVLHAVWTADPEVVRLDGASTAFRSRGRRDGADWSLDDLWKLANDLNDLHQEALAELARQVGAQSSARSE